MERSTGYRIDELAQRFGDWKRAATLRA